MELIEPLNGGVVTSKDADTLHPGELSLANDFFYVSGKDNLIHGPALPETLVRANPYFILGMAPVTFDNGNNYMLAQHDADMRYSTISASTGVPGAWSTLTTHTAATARNGFSAVHYNNKYYIFDGIADNKVLRQNATTRRHGLLPVINAPAVSSATAAAPYWPVNATGYFHYWYTEAMELSGDPEDIVIESAYSATAPVLTTSGGSQTNPNVGSLPLTSDKIFVGSVLVSDVNTTVAIECPNYPRNPEATHYYIYRGGPTEFLNDTAYPIGELIARKPVTEQGPINDGSNSTVTAEFYPQTYVSSSVASTLSSFLSWTTPSNAASINSTTFSNGTYATLSSNTATQLSNFSLGTLIVSTFAISGVNTPVTRISVSARMGSPRFPSSAVQAYAVLSFDGGVSWTGGRPLNNPAGNAVVPPADTTMTTGFVNWGRALTIDELSNSNFRVGIGFSGQNTGVGSLVRVDGIKVAVEGSSTTSVSPVPYPGIVIQSGSTQYVTSRNGEPPISKTGCIFQGSLVVDDVARPSNLRWSMPGDPEAFPALYYLPIETANNDAITYIGLVNNVCVVGLKNSIVRINYLPTEDDASFSRTRIYDYISSNLGILHHRAACVFLTPGGRELLAMMTQDGIYVTDGYTINRWDTDYSTTTSILANMIDAGISLYNAKYLQMCNDVSSGNIFVTYQTSSNTCRSVPFNYSARHLKEGPRFKVGGVFTHGGAYNGCGNVATNTTWGVPVLYFYNNPISGDGNMTTLAKLGNISYTGMSATTPSFNTRRITFNDGDEVAVINTVNVHGSGAGINALTVQAITTLVDDTTTYASPTVTFQGGRVSKADIDHEAFQTYFNFVATSAVIQQLNRLLIDFTRFAQRRNDD